MDFSASNYQLWNFFIQFGILSGVTLLANILRRKIPIVQKSLMPTAVLAGFIALLLRATGVLNIDGQFMEKLTYHTIALGFIAMSLRVPKAEDQPEYGDKAAAKSGALIVSTYLLQGILGILITVALAFTLSPGLFMASGILLPMGYGQGSGQANNVGSMYEQMGFAGGQSFGLSIAAAGFLCACVVGIFYLNILKRQGKIKVTNPEFLSGSVTTEKFEDENEIPVSESVDRLSVQISLVLLVYLASYLLTLGITSFIGMFAPGLAATLSPILWGFNFIIGSILAMVFRMVIKGLQKTKMMTRQYQNNYLLSRISGLAFDFMIVAGIAAIDFKDLSGLWIPFFALAILGGIVTLWYLQWACRIIYKDYYYEGLLSMYGMLTGTISSGIILLREIDPDFDTPAAGNLVSGSSFAILFGAPMLILIGLAPKSFPLLMLTLGLMVIYMAPLVWIMLRSKKTKK